MKKALTIVIMAALSMASYAQNEVLPDADLEEFVQTVQEEGKYWMGYPTIASSTSNLDGFYDWYLANKLDLLPLNNAGDPYSHRGPISSSTFERKVLDFFAPYYGFDLDNVWGLVTASGTDGNNHGVYFGRKYLENKIPELEPIAYVSKESHYSNMRVCDLQHIEVRLIDTDNMGRMLPESLRSALDPSRPALIIYSMGSTFMGAIDDQEALNKVIDEINPIAVYRHVDAALFGGYLPYTKHKDLVDMKKCRYNSIAISGHKFYGLNQPCGLFFTTREVVDAQTAFTPEYLNSNMFMINCSRSGLNPLKFYWVIKRIGVEGFKKQAAAVLDNSDYLKNRLDEINWPAWKNEYSNTVFFRRPSEAIIKKYSLANGHTDEYGDLSHIVVMQHVDRKAIDNFIEDLKAEDAAITDIPAASSAVKEYYDLQGVKVKNPEKGKVYISRQGSESGRKIINR